MVCRLVVVVIRPLGGPGFPGDPWDPDHIRKYVTLKKKNAGVRNDVFMEDLWRDHAGVLVRFTNEKGGLTLNGVNVRRKSKIKGLGSDRRNGPVDSRPARGRKEPTDPLVS